MGSISICVSLVVQFRMSIALNICKQVVEICQLIWSCELQCVHIDRQSLVSMALGPVHYI